MSDLTGFLTARLDDDEAAVRAVRADESDWPCEPDRMLREVAAKRAILDQLGTDLSYQPPVPPGHRRPWAVASLIVEALATVYSDHPDYDPAWRP